MSKQIAFLGQLRGSRYTAGVVSGPSLYMIDEEHSSVRQLTFDLPVTRFAWSPDGQRIACLSSGYAGEKLTETLYLLDADGSHLRRLTDEKGGIIWNWSPDSRQLAFTCFEEDYRSTQRHGALYVRDLEHGETHQITREAAYVVWSADTNEIAFLWSHDTYSISVMAADGANRRLLFQSNLAVSPCSWSPDNTLLACNVWSRSQWGAGYEDRDSLHVLDVEGNIAFQGEWGASWLAWSPDSRRIACIAPFEYYEDEEQGFVESHEYVYVMGRDGSALQPLAPTTDEVGVAWSPDGQKIAFILDDDGYTLGVIDVDRQSLQSYPMAGEDVTGKVHPNTPTWSPDSQQIAYNSPGLEHLYVIGTNETAPRCLTNNIRQPSNEEDQAHGNERAEHNFIINPAWQP